MNSFDGMKLRLPVAARLLLSVGEPAHITVTKDGIHSSTKLRMPPPERQFGAGDVERMKAAMAKRAAKKVKRI